MSSGEEIDPGGAGIAIDPGNADDTLTQDQIDAITNVFNIVDTDPIIAGNEVGAADVNATAATAGNENVTTADPVIAAVPDASSSSTATVVPVNNLSEV